MNDNSFHISNLVRGISTAAILSGLLAVVLGVVMLAWPQPSLVAAAVLFGVYLVVSGVGWCSSRSACPPQPAAGF
jgi:uncharacterized membrane protein HdeD (DUF308 family)